MQHEPAANAKRRDSHRRTTFDAEAMAELKRRYDSGESLYAIAKQMGKRKSSISRAFLRDGIKTRTFSEAAQPA